MSKYQDYADKPREFLALTWYTYNRSDLTGFYQFKSRLFRSKTCQVS